MPKVKFTEPYATLVAYGQPVSFARDDEIDGDLAVRALEQGWPVHVVEADPAPKKPTPVKAEEAAPVPVDKTAAAKRTYRKPAVKKTTAKPAAKKVTTKPSVK